MGSRLGHINCVFKGEVVGGERSGWASRAKDMGKDKVFSEHKWFG